MIGIDVNTERIDRLENNIFKIFVMSEGLKIIILTKIRLQEKYLLSSLVVMLCRSGLPWTNVVHAGKTETREQRKERDELKSGGNI